MTYIFGANGQFAADYLDKQGEHLKLPRSAPLPDGQRVGIEEFVSRGLPPPVELILDLPHTIRIYREPVVTAGYLGGWSCFVFTERALDLIKSFAPPHWSQQVPNVIYSGIESVETQWHYVIFPRLQRDHLVVDLKKSKYIDWVEVEAPDGSRLKVLNSIAPPNKRISPAFISTEISDLTLWKGVGAGRLSGWHFCCDRFKANWDAERLSGLRFDYVLESP